MEYKNYFPFPPQSLPAPETPGWKTGLYGPVVQMQWVVC